MTLNPGEVVALLGASGSGKTTLLRSVAGLEQPNRGRITIGDQVLFDADKSIDLPVEKRNLGLVFQSYALWPHRTVFQNVAYALRLRGIGGEGSRRAREQGARPISGSAPSRSACRTSFPADSSSALPSPAHSSTTRPSC